MCPAVTSWVHVEAQLRSQHDDTFIYDPRLETVPAVTCNGWAARGVCTVGDTHQGE